MVPSAEPESGAARADAMAATRPDLSRLHLPVELWPEIDCLIEHLVSLRSESLVVLLNRGNRGDGVVHEGGLRLLKALGLRYQAIRFPEHASGSHLLVFGCGAFSRYFNHMVAYIGHYRRMFDRVTILPSSFEAGAQPVKSFLRSLGDDRFFVFCRERTSYELIGRLRPDLEHVKLAPDLAFCFDAEPWRRMGQGDGTLTVARSDEESAGAFRVRATSACDPSAGSDLEPGRLLDALAPYRRIHTDRLHAAVCATLLGKEVVLYEGAYHKNRAVFDFTLSRFPNVHLEPRRRGRSPSRLGSLADVGAFGRRLRLRVLSRLRPGYYAWLRWRGRL